MELSTQGTGQVRLLHTGLAGNRRKEEEDMFMKANAFKRLLKEGYKGGVLKMSRPEEDVLLITTGYLMFRINTAKMLPVEKEAVIEFSGEIPLVGETFTCTEMGNQHELENVFEWPNIDYMFEIGESFWKETYVLTDLKGGFCRAMQSEADNSVIWYQEEYLRAVQLKCSRDDELFDKKPVIKDGVCVYKNDVMTYAIWPVDLKHERLNRLLTNLECWKQEHEYTD